MEPTERVIDVDSTLTGENVRMGIDEHAIQHIIGVLTDLYSDPELAVIREYATNALDANREAGNDAPIEVSLPTPLAPFFRVKDQGIGLDAEGIRNIYSRYGASTKRDSDEQVGMLGLGAKSALTYTDQFTLIGTKDGRQVQVSVGRDEDGGGSMTIVSDEPTDQPNGVEIVVPVKRDNGFEEKAREFFSFWKPGTVLVNGEQPEHITEKREPTWLIEDELFVYSDYEMQNRWYRAPMPGYVVMGNVAYPIPAEEGIDGQKYQIVAFVEIGAVNFTPSREALMLTKRTKETLQRIREDVKRELAVAAQRRVENAETPADAIRLVQQAAAMGVKTEGIHYKGKLVPDKLDRTKRDKDGNVVSMADSPESTFLVVNGEQYRSRKNGERYRTIPPYNSSRTIFTGFTGKELSLPMRQKLDVWASDNDVKLGKERIFVDKLSADEKFWLTGTPTYDWTPVKEIKLAKTGNGMVGPGWRQRPSGSYERFGGGDPVLAADIDTSKPILYVSTHERHMRRERLNLPADATIVILPQNRREKFHRDFPAAMEWGAYLRKEAEDWLAQQDPEKLAAIKKRLSGALDALAGLDHERVTDPDLADAIKTRNRNDLSQVERELETHQQHLPGWDRYSLRQNAPDPLAKYPLAADTYRLTLRKVAEHFYLYVNAAYAA